ncbi:MAG: phosphoenolpyruvate--protein phosphotransferase [Clostridia bacterium]|nr:phosphoenolpyruvate--protein phosphotransferase [Clostridia bacterium]
MRKYVGKSVNNGIAIGKISVFKRNEPEVRRESVEDTEKEKQRFKQAKEKALSQLEEIYEKALVEVGETNAQIFEIHMMMVEDEDYNEAIISIIENQRVNAEYAVAVTSDNFREMFSSMDDSYMQAREADIRDVSNRIIVCLSEERTGDRIKGEKVVVCADDLAPSETVSLDKENVLAFVTAHGSANSHTAILARTMNIPAIIGTGEEFLSEIRDGDIAIADGFTGEFFVEPDETTLAGAIAKQNTELEKSKLLRELKGKEDVTRDGRHINIYANIGGADNIAAVLINDAAGIGLFRSEFVYLENDDYPGEELQFQLYKRVLESMAVKKVIIITLDIGAYKQVDYFRLKPEENPALGMRAIRLCLKRPEVFKVQLRALYRASVFGELGIMFPMITSVSEVEEILSLCDLVKAQLKAEQIRFSENIEHGIMIETPAAALISHKLAPLVDFFSVGTNDLIQYTLACDRQNPDLDEFCNPHHEAVMKLIEMSAENAHKSGAWIGICGDLACDLSLTERFLKMGIDELSVPPSFVLKLREKVRSISLS